MKKVFTIIISCIMMIGSFSTISAMMREEDMEYQKVIQQLETMPNLYSSFYFDNDILHIVPLNNEKSIQKITTLKENSDIPIIIDEAKIYSLEELNQAFEILRANRDILDITGYSINTLNNGIRVMAKEWTDDKKRNIQELINIKNIEYIIDLGSNTTTQYTVNFSDISGHWAESTINKWKDKGIIAGYADGTFKPDNPVTRAELAKILTEAFELKEKTSLEEYDDMDSSSWYYPYVQCSEKYIPVYPLAENYPSNMPYIENQEHSGTTFGFLPEVDAIRVHVAEALVEIKKEKENITIELPSTIQDIKYSVEETFPNDPAYDLGLGVPGGGIAGNVARMTEYTYIANKLGIMTGDENGFRPYDKITRAELITVIDRMLSE